MPTYTLTSPTGNIDFSPVSEIELNDTRINATYLPLTEDPAGGGLLLGYGLGSQDPASSYTSWSDPDYWRVELQAGDWVSVSVDTPDSGVDSYLELRNAADGGLVGSSDEGPGSDSFISRYGVMSSGSYYVLVGKDYYSTASGAYQLRVDVARGINQESDANYSNDSISGANVLSMSAQGAYQHASVAGTVMGPEWKFDQDVFALGRLNAGNMVELGTRLPSSSTLSPLVTLLRADGSVVADEDGNGGDGHFMATLVADGDYYAKIESEWTYGGHKYRMTDGGMSWTAAEAYAQSLGGHLVTIDDAAEQQWVAQNFSWATVWTGFTDQAAENNWMWSSGATQGYTNWSAGHPYRDDTYYSYAYMNPDGKWSTGGNSWEYRGLIELDGAAPGLTGAGPDAQYLLDVKVLDQIPLRVEAVGLPLESATVHAPVGPSIMVTLSERLDAATVAAGNVVVWQHGDHFYKLTDASENWVQAEAEAQALGGHLVQIDDAAEQQWLNQTLDGRYGSVWIGLTDQAAEGTWVSSSGVLPVYTNWASGEPFTGWNGYDYAYDYGYMRSDGQWSATPDTNLRGLIEFTATDSDGDGLPDSMDPYPLDKSNAWDLREAGIDGVFDTADDVIHRLVLDGTYTTGTQVKLMIEDGALGSGYYRFTANSTLQDVVGNALDGNGDGTAGDAYHRYFTIDIPDSAHFETRHNNTTTNATVLSLSEDPAGSSLLLGHGSGSQDGGVLYTYWNDPDYWRVELQAGDWVSVSVDTPDSDVNTYVELRNVADGTLVGSSDEGPGSDSFISRYGVTSSGSYYVLVGKDYYSAASGLYQLHVDVARGIDQESDVNYSNDSISGANVLGLTAQGKHRLTTVAGTIMAPEGKFDQDVFALGMLNAGNMVELGARLPSASTLSPLVTLLRADGTVLADADGNAGDGHFMATLVADGDYYAKIESEWTYGGHKYRMTDGGMSWTAAEAYAQSLGGHLVTIDDAAEQQWVAQNFSWATVWTGFTDQAEENTWMWSSGATQGYTNWSAGHPYRDDTYYSYAYMNPDGKWSTGGNSWGYRGLIELDGAAPGTKGSGPEAKYLLDVKVSDLVPPRVEAVELPLESATVHAPLGPSVTVTLSERLDAATVAAGNVVVWQHGDHFYKLTDSSENWVQAEAEAQALGGHLVQIDDAAEQQWLNQTLDGRYGSVWIGLTDQAVEGTWESSTGALPVYSNWASGEPFTGWNGYDYAYDYGYMRSDGQWSATPDTNLRGLIEFTATDSDGDGLPDSMDTYPLNKSNAWDLREAGIDGVFDTADDVIHRLVLDGTYTTGTQVKLMIEDGALGSGYYRFTANSTLQDVVGNALDGNGDGTAGDAYHRYFTIDIPDSAHFETRHNNTTTNATVLSLSEDPAGSSLLLGHGSGSQDGGVLYTYWNDPDYWRVELQAGDWVSVSVDTPDSDVNTYVELRNVADGTLVGSSDEGPGSDSFISRYGVTSSGTYYVLVGKDYYSTASGLYQLHVDVARGIDQESDVNYSNDSISGANVLGLTAEGKHRLATVAGTIMAPERKFDQDVFALGTLNAGNIVELGARLPSASTLSPLVTLLRADGTVVADADGNAGDGHFMATLVADGDYYAKIESEWTYGGHKYRMTDGGMSWTAAEAYAQSLGGHLVTIDDAAEQQWVAQNFSWATVWTGFTDQAEENIWMWSSGATQGYTNWSAGHPYRDDTYYSYAYMNPDGKWSTGGNSWGYRGLIELDGAAPGTKGSGPEAKYLLDVKVSDLVPPRVEAVGLPLESATVHAPLGPSVTVTLSERLDAATVAAGNVVVWQHGDHFYKLTDSSENWVQAEAEAQALGGHLVQIDDVAEQQWLNQTLDGRYGSVWIGLTDQAVEGTWESSTGALPVYSNWASGEPFTGWNGYDYAYDYGYMRSDGQWSATPDTNLRGLIEFTATDSDGDGLPDSMDTYPLDKSNAWDLREAGIDGVFDTADDVIHRLVLDGTYTTGTQVKLMIEDGALGSGYYRFTANSTLQDVVGNALDGNGDGTAGDAYHRYFTIDIPDSAHFETRHNNTTTNATVLSLSEDPAGSSLLLGHGSGSQDGGVLYTYWNDPDYWRVELQAGDWVSVSVDTPDSDVNTYVELRNAVDGTLVGSSDEGPGSDSFISRYGVTSSGTYYVLVGKDYYSTASGLYQLHVDVARGIDQESDVNYSNDSISGANVLG